MSEKRSGEDAATDVAPWDYLARIGESGDGPHDIATAALMLAALDHPETKLASYRAHLKEIAEAARMETAFATDVEFAARSLASILAGRYGYDGDRIQYDDVANADMISVIDRRRGLPVALGILYIHAARASGMEARGLFTPGHFLLRIAIKGGEAMIDPFNGGMTLDGDRLANPRLGNPAIAEPGAPDEPGALEPVPDTDVLLRLQNNIKGRALKARDMARAVEIARRMTLIAPKRPALWLDFGRLQEACGALSSARTAFERCIAVARPGEGLHNEAVLSLQAIKRRLN
jgi:regulator of sirC expression with transglutaminase-like and TPR domain